MDDNCNQLPQGVFIMNECGGEYGNPVCTPNVVGIIEILTPFLLGHLKVGEPPLFLVSHILNAPIIGKSNYMT